jgi:CCR4-NOT transcriptional regulation complex NOT5 subunit
MHSLFTDQTLLFIFETETRSRIQRIAAEELQKRRYTFEDETGKWFTRNGNEWSVDDWREVD